MSKKHQNLIFFHLNQLSTMTKKISNVGNTTENNSCLLLHFAPSADRLLNTVCYMAYSLQRKISYNLISKKSRDYWISYKFIAVFLLLFSDSHCSAPINARIRIFCMVKPLNFGGDRCNLCLVRPGRLCKLKHTKIQNITGFYTHQRWFYNITGVCSV